VIAGRLTSTGYASAWALIHYLAKSKKPELMTLIREASHVSPLTGATDINGLGVVRSNRDAFTKLLGDDFVELESRVVTHLKKQPYTDPFLDAPHFVATFVSTAGRKPQKSVNTFYSMLVAQKWLTDMREKLPEAERATGQAQIRAFRNRMQAEAYVRQFQSQ